MAITGGIAAAGIGAAGSMMSASANKKAARQSADSQIQAAQIAADAARFRPVGVTSSFGGSGFQFDADGNLSGAGYALNPQLQGLVNGVLGMTNNGLDPYAEAREVSSQLGGIGGQYRNLAAQALPQSYDTQAAAQKLYDQQRQMLAPGREQQLAGIQNNNFQTGRTGLSVGSTNQGYTEGAQGLMGTNPELAAYYNSIAQQDAGLLNSAQQTARSNLQQDIAAAMGLNNGSVDLLNAGYGLQANSLGPLSSLLNFGNTVEGMGQQTLGLGAELGGRASTAGAQAGQLLQRGMTGAATTNMQGQMGMNNALGSMLGGFSNPIEQMFAQMSTGGGGYGYGGPGSLFGGSNSYSFGGM